MAALPLDQIGSRGAKVAFTEYEAENGVTNARLIGPDRTFGSLASEASGRKAVRLEKSGDFVDFTLGAPANALVVRYAVPDSADGRGSDSFLSLLANGQQIGSLPTTSRYSWYYGSYPFSNRPADGKAHHFYDEARLLLGRTLPARTKVRLMRPPGGGAAWHIVDLADFELVPPPKPPPQGALPITRYGADPTGKRDSGAAIRTAIATARRRGVTVWIPPGTFRVDRHIIVDRVTIAGAGQWHSLLRGNGIGIYGRKAPRGSTGVVLRDFALIGEVKERVDKAALAGIGGAIGGGSVIEDLWIQHHKVGVWLDGPLDRLTIRRLRIVDNAADGLNFRRGVSNALVEHSFIRNSGDDGLAMWSHREPDRNNIFRNNTVIAPVLANGIAVYGGRDIEVSGNVVADSLTQGGGIHFGNRFDAVPFAGTMNVTGNLMVRAGSFDPNWKFGVGALWFYALDHPIAATFAVNDNEIVDSTLPALHFIGKRIDGVRFRNLTIHRNGAHALQLQSPGGASFTGVRVIGPERGTLKCNADFKMIDLGGNAGLEERAESRCP